MTMQSTPPSSAPQPRDGGAVPTRFERSTLGVVAYTCTVACTRYAKDADKAPAMAPRVELLRMSAEAVAAFEDVLKVGEEASVSSAEAAEPFVGALGELDERLRPLDWAERLVKTYLSLGLLSDFALALANGLPEGRRLSVVSVLERDRFGAFASAQLLPDLADPQLAARLGLWARRVVGEEIGTFRRMLVQFPELLGGGTSADEIHEALSQGAVSRVRGLGLRV